MSTILIAEDDQEIAQLVAMHIEHEGHNTILAYDGQAALDIVMSRSIDLIISYRAASEKGVQHRKYIRSSMGGVVSRWCQYSNGTYSYASQKTWKR